MRRSLLCLLALGLATIGSAGQADLARISLLIGSYHVDAKTDFNQVNPGVFLTWDSGISAGIYANSYGKTSVAVTYGVDLYSRGDFDLGVFAGVALYPQDGRTFAVHAGDWVPIGGIQARYRHAFVQIIPSDGIWTDAIIAAGVTFDY